MVPGPASRYLTRYPHPPAVALGVEVAESSSCARPRGQGTLVCRAGIPAYWILNLTASCVEVYREPSPAGPSRSYRRRQTFGMNEAVPLAAGGLELGPIPVSELLAA